MQNTISENVTGKKAKLTVCISLYNYENYVIETLQSVYDQDLPDIDLLIIDDVSTDNSVTTVSQWLEKNGSRFTNYRFLQNRKNSGLARTRNASLSACDTDYLFILDADNIIYTTCLRKCLDVIERTQADMVYTMIHKFDAEYGLMGIDIWDKKLLAKGNYIDAMSLIRRESLIKAEGYSKMNITGWEDYDLWCKFIDLGLKGVMIPEILAGYRVHKNSMLRTITNVRDKNKMLVLEMKRKYPWLQL